MPGADLAAVAQGMGPVTWCELVRAAGHRLVSAAGAHAAAFALLVDAAVRRVADDLLAFAAARQVNCGLGDVPLGLAAL
eukprot:13469932-Heterocapsa_arctica.AAC.1